METPDCRNGVRERLIWAAALVSHFLLETLHASHPSLDEITRTLVTATHGKSSLDGHLACLLVHKNLVTCREKLLELKVGM